MISTATVPSKDTESKFLEKEPETGFRQMWALTFSGQNDEFDTDEFCLSLDAERCESKTKAPFVLCERKPQQLLIGTVTITQRRAVNEAKSTHGPGFSRQAAHDSSQRSIFGFCNWHCFIVAEEGNNVLRPALSKPSEHLKRG